MACDWNFALNHSFLTFMFVSFCFCHFNSLLTHFYYYYSIFLSTKSLVEKFFLLREKCVKGLTVWLNYMLKFIGKTNRLLILLFLIILCVSDRNLLILAFILLNLIQKLTLFKDRSFPPSYNPPLVQGLPSLPSLPSSDKDQQFVPISFVSIHTPCSALSEWCKDQCLICAIV